MGKAPPKAEMLGYETSVNLVNGFLEPWTRSIALAGLVMRPFLDTFQCPRCSGEGRRYEDAVTMGSWYYCPKCKWSGDNLDLVAAGRRTSHLDALRLVLDQGFVPPECNEIVLRDIRVINGTRMRINACWESIRLSGGFDPALPGTVLFLEWLDISEARFLSAAPALRSVMGVATFPKVYALAGLEEEDRRQPALPVRFRGRFEDDRMFFAEGSARAEKFDGQVLVLPTWDLPGRITGFHSVMVLHGEIFHFWTHPGGNKSGMTASYDPGFALIGPDGGPQEVAILSDLKEAVRGAIRHALRRERSPIIHADRVGRRRVYPKHSLQRILEEKTVLRRDEPGVA